MLVGNLWAQNASRSFIQWGNSSRFPFIREDTGYQGLIESVPLRD